jgi:hypothetical protein
MAPGDAVQSENKRVTNEVTKVALGELVVTCTFATTNAIASSSRATSFKISKNVS